MVSGAAFRFPSNCWVLTGIKLGGKRSAASRPFMAFCQMYYIRLFFSGLLCVKPHDLNFSLFTLLNMILAIQDVSCTNQQSNFSILLLIFYFCKISLSKVTCKIVFPEEWSQIWLQGQWAGGGPQCFKYECCYKLSSLLAAHFLIAAKEMHRHFSIWPSVKYSHNLSFCSWVITFNNLERKDLELV